jgi:DNA primase
VSFPPAFLEEIRSRLALSGVVGRTVRLTRKGREYLGLCPFHNEKTPSFTVNDDKGFFHCFGCGAHGDVIGFVMQSQRLDFREAVERLAGEAGLEMPVESPIDRERAARAASLYDALEAACAVYESALRGPAGRAGLAYLKNRGLDEAAMARFRLGFSPDGRSALKTALKTMPEALLAEAGLVKTPEGGGVSHDYFGGRVMFPITDRRGRVIAFGGRTLGDGQPKYLNSPETPLFHKGGVLYGFAQARANAAKLGTAIVCEGYMDVIALHRAGFETAVAPLGTALTEAQLELLWGVVAEPVICLDGDAAGQRAAMRAAERALSILQPGRSLKFVVLPASEDPDSLLRSQGKAAMEDLLGRAMPMAEMLWRAKFAGLPVDTPEHRQGAEHAIRQFFEVIPDPGLRKDYSFEFIDRLRAAARSSRGRIAIRERAGKVRTYAERDRSGRVTVPLRPSPLPIPAARKEEQLLMALVILHPPLLDFVGERLGELAFADSGLDKLRQEVLKHAVSWGSLDFDAARNQLYGCGLQQNVDCLLEAGAHDPLAFVKPGAPTEEVREAWERLYSLHRQKDLAVDMQAAEQRAAEDMTEENFGYFNALWASRQRGGEI